LATLTATTDDPSLMIPARVAAPSLPFPPLFAGSELAGSELGSDSAGRATYPSAINPLERAGSDTVRHANPLFDSYPQPGDVEHGDRLSSLNSALSHGPTPASDVLGGALAFAMEVGRRGVQVRGLGRREFRIGHCCSPPAVGDSADNRKWGDQAWALWLTV
jgi:hypothetical protein